VRGVIDALLEVRPVGWIIRAFPAFMALTGFISLIGLAADLQAWRNWLGGIDSAVFPVAISSAILLVGLVLLSHQIRSPRQQAVVSLKSEGSDIPKREPAPSPSQPNDRTPPASEKTRNENLADALQRQLDQGKGLQRNMPPMAGMSLPTQAKTTEADVDVWINRTRRLLKLRPDLLADFNYRPPQSPLHNLIRPRTFEPQYKERLDLHVANLPGIIIELRHQNR